MSDIGMFLIAIGLSLAGYLMGARIESGLTKIAQAISEPESEEQESDRLWRAVCEASQT